jgi:hypothetical protein
LGSDDFDAVIFEGLDLQDDITIDFDFKHLKATGHYLYRFCHREERSTLPVWATQVCDEAIPSLRWLQALSIDSDH